MLPFSNSSKHRKFQCFVCGVEFPDYDTFRDHIIESHDQNREYLLCKKCEAPVRDMRGHYKLKHPNTPVPKEGMMKALIWKDFGTKKKSKKPNFKEGYYESAKNDGKQMHYRSGWELEIYQMLDQHNKVTKYEVEPVHVPYYDPKLRKWRKYFPDLLVHFNDGHVEMWEVKPMNQTDKESNPQNHAKWEACAEYCLLRGYRFVIKTEVGIEEMRKYLIREQRG